MLKNIKRKQQTTQSIDQQYYTQIRINLLEINFLKNRILATIGR